MAPVSLQLGFNGLAQSLVEDMFINHAGPGRLSRPPSQEPSVGLFNIFGSGPSFFVEFLTHEKLSVLLVHYIAKYYKVFDIIFITEMLLHEET